MKACPVIVHQRIEHVHAFTAGLSAAESAPSGKAVPPADTGATKGVLLRLPSKLHRHLRQLSLDEDTSLQALGMEALKRMLEKRQRLRPSGA